MDSKLFSVRDAAGDMFGPIFLFETEGLAKRSVMDTIAKGDNLVALHPSDFSLYHVGYWNSRTGVVTGLQVPELICSCDSIADEMRRAWKKAQPEDVNHVDVLYGKAAD